VALYLKCSANLALGDLTDFEADLAEAEKNGAYSSNCRVLRNRFLTLTGQIPSDQVSPFDIHSASWRDTETLTKRALELMQNRRVEERGESIRNLFRLVTLDPALAVLKVRTAVNQLVYLLSSLEISQPSVWTEMPGFINEDELAILNEYRALSSTRCIIHTVEDVLAHRNDLYKVQQIQQNVRSSYFHPVPLVWFSRITNASEEEKLAILERAALERKRYANDWWDYEPASGFSHLEEIEEFHSWRMEELEHLDSVWSYFHEDDEDLSDV
jgi:hypothetical protein